MLAVLGYCIVCRAAPTHDPPTHHQHQHTPIRLTTITALEGVLLVFC